MRDVLVGFSQHAGHFTCHHHSVSRLPKTQLLYPPIIMPSARKVHVLKSKDRTEWLQRNH
jgi:hypothetical protein